MSKCSVEGCDAPVKYTGLCGKHYKRKWRHGSPTATLLNMDGGICKVKGCYEVRKSSDGYCRTHWLRISRYGREDTVRAKNGNGTLTNGGYVLLSINGERVYEHTLLAEKALGRRLPAKAVVHHMNGKPDDNHTPFNLVVCPDQTYHLLLHHRAKKAAIYNE